MCQARVRTLWLHLPRRIPRRGTPVPKGKDPARASCGGVASRTVLLLCVLPAPSQGFYIRLKPKQPNAESQRVWRPCQPLVSVNMEHIYI